MQWRHRHLGLCCYSTGDYQEGQCCEWCLRREDESSTLSLQCPLNIKLTGNLARNKEIRTENWFPSISVLLHIWTKFYVGAKDIVVFNQPNRKETAFKFRNLQNEKGKIKHAGARMIAHCWILHEFSDCLVFTWAVHETLQYLDPILSAEDHASLGILIS